MDTVARALRFMRAGSPWNKEHSQGQPEPTITSARQKR